ncbi:MAG: molybdopterin-dependent oxidoreductase [Helicobacteraceae bacterium]|nr:molybdopterin-dependent oxidoreductase [Helicobacteraceae bacterium]
MSSINSMKRRSFLKIGALAGVFGAAGSLASDETIRTASEAELKEARAGSKRVKTICCYCSVGCGVVAEVKDGVWIRQEVAQDHPISRGGHCCKGADMIDRYRAQNRLRRPIEKVGGKWKATDWDSALDKIAAKLTQLRNDHGPDSVMFIGSSKVSNEVEYYIRKFTAFFGTNNIDNQARICHSPTVAGVANTWGYGAMTNPVADMQNSKLILVLGANPAVNHPIAMQHILKAKNDNGAKIISIDPRFTKTSAKADVFVRIRPGTDIPFVYGLIRILRDEKLYDKRFVDDRVYGMDEIFKECEQYTPQVVADICHCKPEELIKVAHLLAKTKPGTLIWAMGLTQHTIGSSNTRIGPILQLLLGNMGRAGGGTNILRGHDNVQGASDMGCLANELPGYYGVGESAWKYYADQWEVDYEWLKNRFKSPEMMTKVGTSLSLFPFGVLDEANAKHNGGTTIKAVVVIGNGISTVALTHKVKEALEKAELVVFVDPFVADAAVIPDKNDNLFVLPAATQIENSGVTVNTSRVAQWRFQVVEPLYESWQDQKILFELAKRLGFYEEYTRALKKFGGVEAWPECATREFSKACKPIGLQGWQPERIQSHTLNWHLFDSKTTEGGGKHNGEYYGLPWPCWTDTHCGSPILYDLSKPVSKGGMGFRNRFGLEHNGVSQLAAKGSAPVGSSIDGGYPQITAENIESLGIKLTDEEREKVKGKTWTTDDSGVLNRKALEAGLAPYGNARARCIVWEFIDPIPKHREGLHSPRVDLIDKYPAIDDKAGHFRVDTRYRSEQKARDWTKEFPISVVSGRIVEHMGTGTETRASKYLAELAPEMYVEIHPHTAAEYDISDRGFVWIYGANGGKIKVRAFYSYTILPNQLFMPQVFSGWWSGVSLADRFPEGTQPFALGENSNQVANYGYDQQTACPESKISLVRIEKA